MDRLFITGYIRSGTSFLANFLNAQEGCVVYNNFLGEIFSWHEINVRSFTQQLSKEQKDNVIKMLEQGDKDAGVQVMDKLSRDFNNLKELYDNALDAIANNKELKVIGNKVTRQGDKVKNLLDETDMKVIYIYRDIRDVILSAKKIYPDYESLALMIDIKKDYERVDRLKDKRLLIVQFEELILNPGKAAKKLSDFLGINITKELNEVRDKEKGWVNNSSFNDLKELFDPKACYRWKGHLKSEEVKICEILSKGYIKRQKWPLSTRSYSLKERILVISGFYLRKIRRIPFHVKSLFIRPNNLQ